MAKIFITGSADGLGRLAAKTLVEKGHDVVLHARNKSRCKDALEAVPGASDALSADLGDIDETKRLAADVKALGRFDAVIHNAAIYESGGGEMFTVNVLAPYILTALIDPPERLIYMSSGMHRQGHAKLGQIDRDAAGITYSDTKLLVLMLAKAVARKWPDVLSNAVDPGWVPTKMGGANAPDSFESGIATQVWLAVGDDADAKVSGGYFHHERQERYNPEADDVEKQERLLALCGARTGVAFPSGAD